MPAKWVSKHFQNCNTVKLKATCEMPTFAVNSNCSRCSLTDGKKPLKNVVAWDTTVKKVQVVMTDASVGKFLGIVQLLVEPHDVRYAVAFKIIDVTFGSMTDSAWQNHRKEKQIW